MASPNETVLDRIEADARRVMAKLTAARGWDSRRAQRDDRDYLDSLLDEFNALGR